MSIEAVDIQNHTIRLDYLLHALAFIVFPISAFIASGYNCTSKQWFFHLTIATLLALGTEFVQIFVPNRTFNPFDIISNLLGLSIGIVAARIWCRQRIKHQNKNLTI